MATHEAAAYLYQFSRVPPISRSRTLGAFHGLEIAYVFGNLREGSGFDQTDQALSRTMMACWTSFAATGQPAAPGLEAWPAYDPAADKHLDFGDTCSVKSGMFKEACEALSKQTKNR